MSRIADSLPKKPRHLKNQSEEIKDKATEGTEKAWQFEITRCRNWVRNAARAGRKRLRGRLVELQGAQCP